MFSFLKTLKSIMVVIKISPFFKGEDQDLYHVAACFISRLFCCLMYQFFFLLLAYFSMSINKSSFLTCLPIRKPKYLPPRTKKKGDYTLRQARILILLVKLYYRECVNRRLLKCHTLRTNHVLFSLNISW